MQQGHFITFLNRVSLSSTTPSTKWAALVLSKVQSSKGVSVQTARGKCT